MNERIKELYAESVMAVHDAFIDRMLIPSAVDLQFAELIIQECAEQLIKWKDEPFPYDPEFGARLIKTHFGLK